jgi:hypothetical protein
MATIINWSLHGKIISSSNREKTSKLNHSRKGQINLKSNQRENGPQLKEKKCLLRQIKVRKGNINIIAEDTEYLIIKQ